LAAIAVAAGGGGICGFLASPGGVPGTLGGALDGGGAWAVRRAMGASIASEINNIRAKKAMGPTPWVGSESMNSAERGCDFMP